MQIYKFNSILKPVLWGGDKLLAFKHLPPQHEPIGESWELSAMPGRESVVAQGHDRGLTLTQLVQRYGADLVGEDVYRRHGNCFPLLIKLIDARRDLSIQVHPDDEMAQHRHGCSGKNEMWYILEADQGAIIRAGFNRQLTPEEFDRCLADGTILEVINETRSQSGDTFFIPAGQIHTIGAGNMLVEIQQSSDVTYRVWDYNRRDASGNLRELHVQEAREALSFDPRDGQVLDGSAVGHGMTRLVDCREFTVHRLEVEHSQSLGWTSPHSFVAMVCIAGQAVIAAPGIDAVTLAQGETALVPARVDRVEVTGRVTMLIATIPNE